MNSRKRRRLYLMRHGSVDYFTPEGKPLPPQDVPLNDKGRAQAGAAGRLFGEHGVKFDRIITSGLPRTVQTASHVAAATGHEGLIEARDRMQEIRGGRLASIAERDLLHSFTAATDGVVDHDVRFLGGESVGEMLERVLPEVDALRADRDWDTMLLVLHGAVNRAILSYLATGRRELLGAFEQSPGCINVLDIGEQPVDVVLRVVNLSPLDWLQPDNRKSTMEHLFEKYMAYRSTHGPS
ncbi:MAG TPA: histidine phosphatase family protein [Usitatibacteraceae bacterium]|nr:histidine phosphatase family protein [Usitatibacteraceae bacterium]